MINKRLEEAKTRYELLGYVERCLGKPVRSGNPAMFRCPFHSDHDASLAVYRDGHFYCFGAGCGAKGDLVNFVALFEGCTLSDAIGYLLQDSWVGTGANAPGVRTDAREDGAVSVLSMTDVLNGYRNIGYALPYLRERKIDETLARQQWLGAALHFPTTYETLDGERIRLACLRYTIPNVWNGTVRAINMRRSDVSATEAIRSLAEKQGRLLRRDVALREGVAEQSLDERKIVEAVFPKYQKRRTSRNVIYNLGRVVEAVKGDEIVYHALSYILIVEGEFDALALESAGYPAIALKVNRQINPALALKNVPLIFIVADNDPPITKAGGLMVYPALEMAHELRKQIGRGRVITPPRGFKDANDVVIDGSEHRWLSQYGIEPILRGAQNG